MNTYPSSIPSDLLRAGEHLVQQLGGQWHGHSGICLCPAHNDRTPSLSVRLGTTRLLFKCFAGCDIRSVLRELYRLSLPALGGKTGHCTEFHSDAYWLRKRARVLWNASHPIDGTIAKVYLRSRCIDIAADSVRYGPRTPLGKGPLAQFRPALLAAITDERGVVALQRTFLTSTGEAKSDVRYPRRLLGDPGAGAARLAPATAMLGVAEGIETALSAMILLGIPVWATLGSERLARVAIPSSVTSLILLPDNDRAGQLGASAASVAHRADGRSIETIWPWFGLNDWNDVLRRQRGEGEEMPWRLVA
ncbi:MAG: toprim domain-containing protein [Sphingopyxis sp.]|nr:toprim domain-containing protein [Sphingopyxis sp.]